MRIVRAKLNLRQERFVLEYLKDGNGTKAAIRAGYATSSAAVHAHRLLKNERVVDKVRTLQDRVQRRSEVTAEKVRTELIAIANFDMSRLLDRKGNLLPLHKIPADALRVIERLEVRESVKGGRRVRTELVKLANKAAALNTLARCMGPFPKPRTEPEPT